MLIPLQRTGDDISGANPTGDDSTRADFTGYASIGADSNGADPTGVDSIDTESTDACVHIPEISTRSNKIAQIYLPDLPLFAPLQSSSSAIGIEVIQIRNPAFF